MAKYYFRKDDENCYEIETHFSYMRENGITEMEVFEAKRETGTGYFFCKHHLEVGEVGQSCGVYECESYIPNNGKNGRCKYSGYVYEQTDKKITLQLRAAKKLILFKRKYCTNLQISER